MQSTKPLVYDQYSTLESYLGFTAWEHTQQPQTTLKILNNRLSYLQNQYKTICKGESLEKSEQKSLFYRKRSLSKVINVQENQIKLPEVKPLKKGKSIIVFKSKGKENFYSKASSKLIETKFEQQKVEEKKKVLKRRSGSEFSELRDYFKAEIDQKEIFLPKNKVSNISKTLNLKKMKNQSSFSFKHQPFRKASCLALYRKISKNSLVLT